MTVVASSIFCTMQFPLWVKIVTIDQLDFCNLDAPTKTTNSVPLLGHSKPHFEEIGVSLLKDSPIIKVFPEVPGPFSAVNMISSSDPWLVPTPLEIESLGDRMPLSLNEKTYERIQSLSYHPESCDHHVALDSYHQPFWLQTQDLFTDYLSFNLPSDESIMEAMNVE